jgi:hypothetical protein
MALTDEQKDVIKRFQKFGKSASTKFDKTIKRVKEERAFASGYQWDSADTSHRGTNRAELTFNITGNQINSVVNPFLSHPYKVTYSSLVENPGDLIEKLNLSYQRLDAQADTKTSKELAIRGMSTSGYGYLYVTTDLDDNKKPVIKIYPIEDSALVIPDPDSTQVDGSDASKMAIIEYMSKTKAKALYGEDVVESSYTGIKCLVSDFGETWKSPEEYLALVTFYEMTESRNACVITKMIGNKVLSSVTLQITHIPIVTFKGEISYDKDGKTEYVGLVHKIVDGQKVLNYAESQLIERLANAPVPVMSIPTEGIEGNQEQYRNINKRLNPVIITKQYTKDGKEIREPKRIDNSFPTGDISDVIGQQKSIIQEVSGMPLSGMVDAKDQETATSILLRTKSTVNNISHFLSHAKQSMKFLGVLLMEFYKVLVQDSVVDTSLVAVTVTEGPETIFNSEEAKAKLIAIANFLPETMKPIIAYYLCTLDVNPDVKKAGEMLKNMLPPQALSDNGQAMMLQQQMEQMQAQTSKILADKDKQIADLANQVLQLQLRANSDVTIAQMKTQADLAKEQMRLNADSQKQQLDIAAKANMENRKIAAEDSRERERLMVEASKTQTEAAFKAAELESKNALDMIDRGFIPQG